MGKSVAVVPAVAPVTEPAPIIPEGTDRTMVTGSTPEEEERRSPVEEPLASPVHTALLEREQLLAQLVAYNERSERSLQWLQRLGSTEKETTTAELPATAPVSVPAPVTVPRTPDRTWRVRESSPQRGGPSRGYSLRDEYFGRRDREIQREREIRRGSWNGQKTPPLMD